MAILAISFHLSNCMKVFETLNLQIIYPLDRSLTVEILYMISFISSRGWFDHGLAPDPWKGYEHKRQSRCQIIDKGPEQDSEEANSICYIQSPKHSCF